MPRPGSPCTQGKWTFLCICYLMCTTTFMSFLLLYIFGELFVLSTLLHLSQSVFLKWKFSSMKLFHPFNMRIFLQFVVCTIFEILVLFVSPCWPRVVPSGTHYTASKYWIKQIPLSSTGSRSNTTVTNATHSGRSTALHFYSTLSLVIPTSTLESTREKVFNKRMISDFDFNK